MVPRCHDVGRPTVEQRLAHERRASLRSESPGCAAAAASVHPAHAIGAGSPERATEARVQVLLQKLRD